MDSRFEKWLTRHAGTGYKGGMRSDNAQPSIRSAFPRSRAQELARQTGLTATQIVEDALMPVGVGGLVRRGPILVRPARGATVTLAAAEAALEAARNRLP